MCYWVIPFKVLLGVGITVPILQIRNSSSERQNSQLATKQSIKDSSCLPFIQFSNFYDFFPCELHYCSSLFPSLQCLSQSEDQALCSLKADLAMWQVSGTDRCHWEAEALRICLLCHIISLFSLPLDQQSPRSRWPVNLCLKVKTIQWRVRAICWHIRKEPWDLGMPCYTV